MSEESKELNIGITTSYNGEGAGKANADVQKLASGNRSLADSSGDVAKKTDAAGESIREAGHAAEESGISHYELRKILLDIGNVAAPNAGRALSELAFGPIGAALALVGAYEILKGKIEDLDKDLDAQGEKASEAFSNIKANLYDAIRDEEFSTDKIDVYFKKIEDDANRAKTAVDNALALTKAKDSAAQEINNAKEQLALEQIKNNPNLTDGQKTTAEAATRNYYAREKARLEKDQNSAELKSVIAERDALQKQLNDLLFKQNKENSVTPEKQAQIDRAVSQLDPKDALRLQYEKDKAAGTIDYAKISSGTAATDTAVQLENLKSKLGLDPQTGVMKDGGDAKRAADKNKELQKRIDEINQRIAGVQEVVATSRFANERENAQTAIDFYKTQRTPIQGEIDANNAPVEADKKRIEQLENAAKIIAEGAEEQKKLNAAVATVKEKVEAAAAQVDLITQTTGIKNATIDTVLKTDEATKAVKPGADEWQADKGIADKVAGNQPASSAEQQRLIAAAEKIAGQHVDLNTAVQIMENGANNFGRFVEQLNRLTAVFGNFDPVSQSQLRDVVDHLNNKISRVRQNSDLQ